MPLEVLLNSSCRTAMTRFDRMLAHDESGDPRLSRFVGLCTDPVVPDQGICHADDLAAERWIRRDLLIANHGGRENHFTLCVDRRTETFATKYAAIRQRQCRIGWWRVPRPLADYRNWGRQWCLTRHDAAHLHRRTSTSPALAPPCRLAGYLRHATRAGPILRTMSHPGRRPQCPRVRPV